MSLSSGRVFITFEGGEGAGKTTLIDKIYQALLSKGLKVAKTRAPGGTKVGEEIRHLLLNRRDHAIAKRCELLLFLADRAQHVEEVIFPLLEEGQIVLCDRFNDSTLAYQGGARGFNREEVRKLCDFACLGLQPQLTLYLDIDPKVGLDRVLKAGFTKDRIESEQLAFHQKIREAFHQIAKEEPKRFQLIDAHVDRQTVFKEAMKRIESIL